MPTQASSAFFKLGRPQCRRIIDVDIERAGELPEIPPPKETYTDGDLKGTLLEFSVDTHPPTLSADGVTPLYRLTAHYVYGMNRAPTEEEKFRLGVAPQTMFKRDDDEVKFDPKVAYGNKELEP